MMSNRSYFENFRDIPPGSWTVNGVGNTTLHATGVGTVPIHSYVNGKVLEGELKKVLYVPELGVNLYSIGRAADMGINVNFSGDIVEFTKDGAEIMVGQKLGKSLYHLKIVPKLTNHEETANAAAHGEISLRLAHLRLVHLNDQTIIRQNRIGAVKGLDVSTKKCKTDCVCEGCALGKMMRSPFPPGRTRATEAGGIIHTDVGFVSIPTTRGEICYAIFKDDYSGWTSVRLMKRKSEAAAHLLNFIAFVETSTGNKVKIVRSDQGTELGSNYLKARLQELGIVHQTSCRYTPQQNGVAERMNRTGMEAVRSIIYTRSNKITNMFEQTPRSVLELWGDFLIAVVYVLNRVISSTSTKTPYELFFGTKPDLNNLRVIGCRAYPHTPDPIRKSLDPKSKPCWFVGYGDGQKGWIVWNPTTREYITSPSVRFDETLLITDVPESKGSQMNVFQKNFEPFHIVSTILGLVTS